FVVAQAPAQPDSLYKALIGGKNVLIANNQTYNLLKQSTAALVTSGTATLETALFGVPEVVCYKGNPVSYWLATKLVDVKYISLVNLIMDKEVITELIQDDFNPQRLETELRRILEDRNYLQQLKQDYAALWNKLGSYSTSELAADEIIQLLRN
ncbi:MAG: lipid-A-disaccharide synthase, partial [Taibaiella sp.]|nr:lipid-A-disaccharide synthase [Taibaiella sp.]